MILVKIYTITNSRILNNCISQLFVYFEIIFFNFFRYFLRLVGIEKPKKAFISNVYIQYLLLKINKIIMMILVDITPYFGYIITNVLHSFDC